MSRTSTLFGFVIALLGAFFLGNAVGRRKGDARCVAEAAPPPAAPTAPATAHTGGQPAGAAPTAPAAAPRPAAPPRRGPDPQAVHTIPVHPEDPTRGPADARVTIVIFSDFQCPWCARVAPALDELARRYPRDVRIVFKQFPLPMHAQAPLAAEASLAAHAQGKFWPMHDKLFANFRALGRDVIEGWAGELGLDSKAFRAALDAGTYRGRVQADLQLGARLGVAGTPTLFLNGRLVTVPATIDALDALVQKELNL